MSFTITVSGISHKFDAPVKVAQALEILLPQIPPGGLMGAFEGNRVHELCATLDRDATLSPITYSDEEGRRIYERSLRFVFLLAAKRCFPGVDPLIEHSLGQGVYVEFDNLRLTSFDIGEIEREMRHIISCDLPFYRHRWTREKAIDYIRQNGS